MVYIENYQLQFISWDLWERYNGQLNCGGVYLATAYKPGHKHRNLVLNCTTNSTPTPIQYNDWEWFRLAGIRGWVIVRNEDGNHTKYTLGETQTEALTGQLTFPQEDKYEDIWHWIEDTNQDETLFKYLNNNPGYLNVIIKIYHKAEEHMAWYDAMEHAINTALPAGWTESEDL